MDERNKFTESEVVVGVLGALLVDGICIAIDLTGVGLAIAPIIQGAATFGFGWWIKSKGGAPAGVGRWLARLVPHLLPVTPILITAFTVTIVFAVEVVLHNHPKAVAVATKAAGPAGKIASKVLKKAA